MRDNIVKCEYVNKLNIQNIIPYGKGNGAKISMTITRIIVIVFTNI